MCYTKVLGSSALKLCVQTTFSEHGQLKQHGETPPRWWGSYCQRGSDVLEPEATDSVNAYNMAKIFSAVQG